LNNVNVRACVRNILNQAIFVIGEFVIGRVIKAMNSNWHPLCFRCEECNGELADAGFIKCQGRALCHTCNANVKAGVLGKHICHQCQYVIIIA